MKTHPSPRLQFGGLAEMGDVVPFVGSAVHAELRAGWTLARSRFQLNRVAFTTTLHRGRPDKATISSNQRARETADPQR